VIRKSKIIIISHKCVSFSILDRNIKFFNFSEPGTWLEKEVPISKTIQITFLVI